MDLLRSFGPRGSLKSTNGSLIFRSPIPTSSPRYVSSLFSAVITTFIYPAGTTLADVRLELAREDGKAVMAGDLPVHEVSLGAFVALGIDIEERQ